MAHADVTSGSRRAAHTCVAAALAWLLLPASVRALEPTAPVPGHPAPWGFSGVFGTGSAGGDFGNLFVKPVTWELNFFRPKGAWRFGAGVTFASFKMKEPYQTSWVIPAAHLSATRMLLTGMVRPYIQVRAGIACLRRAAALCGTLTAGLGEGRAI